VKLERIVLYDRARPYASREVVLGDKLTCRLNQNFDDFECAASDRDWHSTRSQFTPSEINLPLVQLIHQSSAVRAHSSPLFRISHVSSEFGGAQAARTGSVAGQQPLLRRALRSPYRFPGKVSQFLRNIQDCFKELSRVARIDIVLAWQTAWTSCIRGLSFIRTRRHFAIKKSESASSSWSRE
jgi:hypothetical protein